MNTLSTLDTDLKIDKQTNRQIDNEDKSRHEEMQTN